VSEYLTVEEYLEKPYARVVVPQSDGKFRATILEFRGCEVYGGTAIDALEALEKVARDWLERRMANQQSIRRPLSKGNDSDEYYGKMVVQIPKSLHRQIVHKAELEDSTPVQVVVDAVSKFLGE